MRSLSIAHHAFLPQLLCCVGVLRVHVTMHLLNPRMDRHSCTMSEHNVIHAQCHSCTMSFVHSVRARSRRPLLISRVDSSVIVVVRGCAGGGYSAARLWTAK
jgi:hypothetical protein